MFFENLHLSIVGSTLHRPTNLYRRLQIIAVTLFVLSVSLFENVFAQCDTMRTPLQIGVTDLRLEPDVNMDCQSIHCRIKDSLPHNRQINGLELTFEFQPGTVPDPAQWQVKDGPWNTDQMSTVEVKTDGYDKVKLLISRPCGWSLPKGQYDLTIQTLMGKFPMSSLNRVGGIVIQEITVGFKTAPKLHENSPIQVYARHIMDGTEIKFQVNDENEILQRMATKRMATKKGLWCLTLTHPDKRIEVRKLFVQ